jgi:addiction module HigA family antidote
MWQSHDGYDVDLVRSYAAGNPLVAEKQCDLLPPIHPGDILLQDFTRPHLISMNELALAMCLTPTQIDAVIDGKLGITADAAFGLGSFFGTSAELWLNLQRDYDLQVAESARLAAVNGDVNTRASKRLSCFATRQVWSAISCTCTPRRLLDPRAPRAREGWCAGSSMRENPPGRSPALSARTVRPLTGCGRRRA